MLPFLKKPSDNSQELRVHVWHPNFRNFQRLPDTKAVRTTFFVNGLAVLAATGMALYAGYREYILYSLRADTETARIVVEKNKPESDKAVLLFKKFQEEEQNIIGLRDFLASGRLTLSDFILKLGAGLPDGFSLMGIDYTATAVVLRGGVTGAADEASGRAVAYTEGLKSDVEISKLFDPISLANIARDPTSGQIQFEINLKFKAGDAKPAGGKK